MRIYVVRVLVAAVRIGWWSGVDVMTMDNTCDRGGLQVNGVLCIDLESQNDRCALY